MDGVTKLLALVDVNQITDVLIKWNKASTNEELVETSKAFQRVFVFMNKMELELLGMEKEVSYNISAKNRAILSKRKVEAELEEALKELKNKTIQLKIFTG
tara:strand:- start:1168 stop:1470 length:303 start_codon:yes stop_codon:yes gene_type:complete